jgi:hypothetical protein
VFEAPVQQQPLFETPALDEAYYHGDKPPMEFRLAVLLGGTADKIAGTQLSGAPPVTQSTQEQQHAMMEDFHDSTLEAAASMEVDAWAATSGVATPQTPTGAWACMSGSATPQAATGAGADTSG